MYQRVMSRWFTGSSRYCKELIVFYKPNAKLKQLRLVLGLGVDIDSSEYIFELRLPEFNTFIRIQAHTNTKSKKHKCRI